MQINFVNPRKTQAVIEANKRANSCLELIDWAEQFLAEKDRDSCHDPQSKLMADQRAALFQVESRGAETLRQEVWAMVEKAEQLCDYCGHTKASHSLSVTCCLTGREEVRNVCSVCYCFPDNYARERHAAYLAAKNGVPLALAVG